MCDQCPRHRLPEPSPEAEAVVLLLVSLVVPAAVIVILGSLLGYW